ncbi:hypothetical protein AAVH_34725, partial [Aphelenchoides avenae]
MEPLPTARRIRTPHCRFPHTTRIRQWMWALSTARRTAALPHPHCRIRTPHSTARYGAGFFVRTALTALPLCGAALDVAQ